MKAPTKKNVPDKPWLAVDVYICPKGEEDGGLSSSAMRSG